MCDNQQLVEKEIAKVHGKNKQNQRAYCAFGVDYFKRQFNTAFPKYCIFVSVPANNRPQTFPCRRQEEIRNHKQTHTHTYIGSEP